MATIDLPTLQRYLPVMEGLKKIRERIDLILDHLQGKSISAISEEWGVSRPTVRKWIQRYEREGVHGLLDRTSPGRPPEISTLLRKEIVRLTLETRPPPDLGEQWTTRTLGEVFGISPSHIANIWREEGIDPPLHLQQVEKNPNRMVPLNLRIRLEGIPAWLRMHFEMHLLERGWSPEEFFLASILEETDRSDPSLQDSREQALEAIRARRSLWEKMKLKRPTEDPRQPEYLLEMKRRAKHED